MKNYVRLLAAGTCLLALVAPEARSQSAKIGALAIDRSNGFYYGFSYDHGTRANAETRALDECRKRGGNCTVVLVWQGNGCGAYRTINGNVGTAYGWGVAATRNEADAIATAEVRKRSNGQPANNFVWACNTAGTFKEIYNAGAPESTSDQAENVPTVNEYLSFNGTRYSSTGGCMENNTALVTSDDENLMVIMNNLPSAGSRTVNAKYYTEGCTSCLAIQFQDLSNEKIYIATSGSFSRNGDVVTVDVTVQELEAMFAGGSSQRVSASFTCTEE